MKSELPDYKKPPLNEVVIGVQFAPLDKLKAVQFGSYWQRIKDRYPQSSEQLPLSHVIELQEPTEPSPEPMQQRLILSPRCWFLDATGCELIQVQLDRFLRNWRQVAGTEEYPRFMVLFEAFLKEWEAFKAFLAETELGHPAIDQCEITYVNHLLKGREWNDLSDLKSVFSIWSGKTRDSFLPTAEAMHWQAKYRLPDDQGRLYIELVPGRRKRDQKDLLSLNLTARGAPRDGSEQSMKAWFDLAHEWIVRAFADLSSPETDQIWERTK